MKDIYLDKLVESGMILEYKYEDVDSDGNYRYSEFNNSQLLSMVFPNGMILIVETSCDAWYESSTMLFDLHQRPI